MPASYFRLLLRCFGDTPQRQAEILSGTSLSDDLLVEPAAEISLAQQICQIRNLARLFGDGWALLTRDLWGPSVHGHLGIASVAAPDFAGMVDIVARFSFVRAPFQRISLRCGSVWSQIDYELTVPLEEEIWRPLMEISFITIRSGMASILATTPREARFLFACAEPRHAPEVRAVLGEHVSYGAVRNAIRFPSAWLPLASPYADAKLYGAARSELEAASQRLSGPIALRGRVERLLANRPSGRLTADEAAHLTGVSRRTLVRRLNQAGASYRQLLDTELRSRAERLLHDGGLSHMRIAEVLGYTDPTSFSRACRRWFRPDASIRIERT